MTETQLIKGDALKKEWEYLEKELSDINKIIANEGGRIMIYVGKSGYVYFEPKTSDESIEGVLDEINHGLKIARDLIEMRITHLKEIFNKI